MVRLKIYSPFQFRNGWAFLKWMRVYWVVRKQRLTGIRFCLQTNVSCLKFFYSKTAKTVQTIYFKSFETMIRKEIRINNAKVLFSRNTSIRTGGGQLYRAQYVFSKKKVHVWHIYLWILFFYKYTGKLWISRSPFFTHDTVIEDLVCKKRRKTIDVSLLCKIH